VKFRESSSGCKPRPARGEPTQPVASLATVAATPPAMRRYASVRAVGNAATKVSIPGAESALPLEGDGDPDRHGRGRDRTRRGVRPWHARRGRPSNLGGPRSSSVDNPV
jgi:hypothetical protein